jgi:hypothetical protein
MAAQPERDVPSVSSNRASLLLVAKCPIRAQKTKHNGGSGLYIARQMRKRLHEQASQETRTRANPERALTYHMAEGFYAMSRSIRKAKGESAGPGKTTKNLAISQSCKSAMSFSAPQL